MIFFDSSQTVSEKQLENSPLQIKSVSKNFSNRPVVNNLSFSMNQGEILGLLGPNGAGKSTTINMIAGMLAPDQGSISIFGFDNRSAYLKTRRLVGVMHQDQVKIHSGYYGVRDDPAWRRLIVEQMELGPHLEKKYLKLSGGMRRRFMLAKSLLHKPRLIILDEPTAGVDVELRSRLWAFVREINNSGISVLLTTHYLDEAEEMCDRIAFMSEGRLITLEPTRSLIEKVGEQNLTLVLSKGAKQKEVEGLKSWSPFFVGSENKELKLSLKSGSELPVVMDKVRVAGLGIEDVYLSRPDLEDVFLRLSRESEGL